MKNPLVLTLDFGTQSLRTSLIDKEGNIVGLIKKSYEPPYFSRKKGYAEQEADFYWAQAVEGLKAIAQSNPDDLKDIAALTVTSFRDTAVLLDKDMKPVRPCILWLDQRLAKASEKVNPLFMFIFKLVGMGETIRLNRKRTMAHWIKENEPESWEMTDKYVNISTYITYKLTGFLKDSVSNMTGHYPTNYKKRCWHKEGSMMDVVFGIPHRMLCELVQPGDQIGCLKDDVAEECGLPKGIKFIATGADKGCETIGCGALSNEIGAVSYGTACTIEVSNKKYHEPEPFLPAYAAAVPGWYNMDVQIYRGYWMLKWFSKEFAGELLDEAKIKEMSMEELLNKGLELVPPGSDGLILQPYWGPGLARPYAKGSMIGFSDVITKNHFYRAIIEGIAFALKEGLESIEKSQKHKVQELRISGGGGSSDIIAQITADIFNLPVSRVQTTETTSLGAAMAVLTALGEYSSIEEATEKMIHVTKTFIPNKKNAATYETLFREVYVTMYPRLKPVYKTIKELHRID